MAVLVVQAIPRGGLAPVYTAVAAADRVPPGSVLHYKNASATAVTLTLIATDTADGDLVVSDRAIVSLPAIAGSVPGMVFVRVPNAWPYVDPADGLVGITASPTASVTVAVLSAP